MPFELKLALKYFRAKRKSLARFTSIVAVVGIAAGVAALIIAQSLAKGFQDEMRDKILANTAHISIFRNDGAEISDWPEITEKIKTIENIREIMPTAYENAVLIGESETSFAVLRVSNSKFQTSNSKSDIGIGKLLAEKLRLKIGDAAEIMTLENQTPTRVRIIELIETGLYDYDSAWLYVSPEMFAKLRKQNFFTPRNLSLTVRDIYKSAETAAELRAVIDENFKVVDWQEANRPLFAALSLERKVALTVIGLIIFISALNITTTLAMLVNERRLDIAILRTCGARTRSLLTIFLLEGIFLGVLGIFFGVCLGLAGCMLGNYFRLVSISAEVYSLSYIPFRPEISNVLLIILFAFLLCLTAIFYPALKASRLKPFENLRIN